MKAVKEFFAEYYYVIFSIIACICLILLMLQPWTWKHDSAHFTITNKFAGKSIEIEAPDGYFMTEYRYIEGDSEDEVWLAFKLEKHDK